VDPGSARAGAQAQVRGVVLVLLALILVVAWRLLRLS
jgi:flagellar biogenesis protein FliO